MKARRIITTTLVLFILLGVFGVALNKIYGIGAVSYITPMTVENAPDLTFYKMDIWRYIENIKTNVGDVARLQLTLPTRVWNADLLNNLALMLDYWIVLLNVVIYPLRLGGYILSVLYTVMGLDMINPVPNTQWLVDLVQGMVHLQIPYI